jgi:hypothetical protein
MFKKNTKFEILTEDGWRDFLGIQGTKHKKYITISFSDGSQLKCSENHLIMTVDGWKEAKDIDCYDYIYGKNSCLLTVRRKRTEESDIILFDPINVEKTHSYFSETVLSHNCIFQGSSDTLLSGPCLISLVHKTPLTQGGDGLDIYENPVPGHEYVMCVDVATGNGMDYSTFSIIDLSQFPYKQVAKYRNNEISTLVFPEVIYRAATKYNNAWVLIEQNQDGGQVSNDLHDDFEYQNIIYVRNGGRKGQIATLEGFGKKVQLGVKTSAMTKRIGCSMLKTLMEDKKLIVEDYDTIYEFSTFVSKRKSFEAEPGRHDDLVMSLVLFGWLSSQPVFNELLDVDVKESALDDRRHKLEESMSLMGFFDDGIDDAEDDESFIDSDGQFWQAEKRDTWTKSDDNWGAGGLFY